MTSFFDFLSPRPRRPRIRLSTGSLSPPRRINNMATEQDWYHHNEDPPISFHADSSSSPFVLSSSSHPYSQPAPLIDSLDAMRPAPAERDLLTSQPHPRHHHSHPQHTHHTAQRSSSFYTQHRHSFSFSSSASRTPSPSVSREASPSRLPLYTSGSGASVSSSCSGDESGPENLLLGTHRLPSWRRGGSRPHWWSAGGSGPALRRGRRREFLFFRTVKRVCRRLVRLPFFPKTPFTVVSVLSFLCPFLDSIRRAFCIRPIVAGLGMSSILRSRQRFYASDYFCPL